MSNLEQKRTTILAFEGPDKSGKSTLIKELNRISNFQLLCIDRFTGSAWVYDQLTGRRDRTMEITRSEEELARLDNSRVFCILLKCNSEQLRTRINQYDENPELRIQQLDQAIKFFDRYAHEISRLAIIEIDTSNKSVEEAAREILVRISDHE